MIFADSGSPYAPFREGLFTLIVRAIRIIDPRSTGIDSHWTFLPVYHSRDGMDAAQCASDGLVEDFFLSFLGDKGLESGYDLVAAGHDAIHL